VLIAFWPGFFKRKPTEAIEVKLRKMSWIARMPKKRSHSGQVSFYQMVTQVKGPISDKREGGSPARNESDGGILC